MSYEVVDFQQDVIEASRQQPVLVDFWAAWCGPCRMIGPVLEKLAGEAAGQWKLVKVDTEANPGLAQQYRIQGIPNMKLFVDGQVVAELSGALPEPQIRQWLDDNIPSEAKQQLAAALQLVETDPGTAQVELEKILAAEPGLAEAGIALARLLMADDPERSAQLVQQFRNAPGAEELVAMTEICAEQLPEPDGSLAAELAYRGLEKLQQQAWDAAGDTLLQLAREKRDYADRFAARAFRALFLLLGPQHAVTNKYRRDADMALF